VADLNARRNAIARARFFLGMPDAVIDHLAAAATEEPVPASRPILVQDEPGDAIYVVVEGVARVHDGATLLARIGAGESFGELSTFEESVCSASVTAETDMRLLRLGRSPLLDAMEAVPGAGAALTRSLCRCLRERTGQIVHEAQSRQMLEREMEIGRRIQAGFLPSRLPEVAGWDIAAYFRAARDVGGDFYDAFEIDGQRHIGLIVGDVCDKGVGAALFMTLFRSLLRAAAKSQDYRGGAGIAGAAGDPPAILRNSLRFANDYIARTHGDTSMFATLFFGLLDPVSGQLHYVNAGHEEPLLVGTGGVKGTLGNTGPAVGLFEGVDFDVADLVLMPGEMVLAYTDGVTDAVDSGGKQFTAGRMRDFAAAGPRGATGLVAGLADAVERHMGGAVRFDDVTILSVSRSARD